MPLPWKSKDNTKQDQPLKWRKTSLDVPPRRVIESLSRFKFSTISTAIGLALLGLAIFLAAVVTDSREPHILSWKVALLREILGVVGTTIIASTLFYVFYSRFLEREVLQEVTEEAAEVAADHASQLYQSRFSRMMPTKIYPATRMPMPDFEAHLEEVLRGSRHYKFKGDNGGYTVFRLDRLCKNSPFLDKDIELQVLDPQEKYLLRERAKIELAESNPSYQLEQLEPYIDDMRNNIYVTIVAAFDVRHKTRIRIRFHKEHLFFRSEIFDGGIFLTYYLGGEFPSTCFYDRETMSYDAFLENFRQIWKSGKPTELEFSTQDGDDWLRERLAALGCDKDLTELRKDKEQLFESYGQMGRPLGMARSASS